MNGDAQAVPKFAPLLRALLQADVARGRSIRDLVRVSDLLAATGAPTYASDAARWLRELTLVADLLYGNGERVRQIGSGVVKQGERRGEEFVLVEVDRGTIAFARRPGARDVRLTFTARPGFAHKRNRLNRLLRRPPQVQRPREHRTQPGPRRVRVHSGSRGDPPGDGEDDDDPHDARRALRPAGALPDDVAARRRR